MAGVEGRVLAEALADAPPPTPRVTSAQDK
jgi:hypothetical protein